MIKYFSLPDYWNHFFEIQVLFQYRQLHPSYFYEDRIFNSAYGLPPDLIWNGGRVMPNTDHTLTYMQVFNYYRALKDFHLRHTCTNIILNEELIQEKKCNDFIYSYYNPQDYIIFSNELLHKHLSLIVPEDHFIYSTTMGIKDLKQINQYSKNNLVVLDYSYNNNESYLKQLDYPSNIEILCGELCIDDCPHRMKHYIAVSKTNAHIPLDIQESDSCFFKEQKEEISSLLQWYLSSFKHAITTERIDELAALGFQNFKIAGRTRNTEQFFTFVNYYLILPQYQDIVKQELIIQTEKLKLKHKIARGSYNA